MEDHIQGKSIRTVDKTFNMKYFLFKGANKTNGFFNISCFIFAEISKFQNTPILLLYDTKADVIRKQVTISVTYVYKLSFLFQHVEFVSEVMLIPRGTFCKMIMCIEKHIQSESIRNLVIRRFDQKPFHVKYIVFMVVHRTIAFLIFRASYLQRYRNF